MPDHLALSNYETLTPEEIEAKLIILLDTGRTPNIQAIIDWEKGSQNRSALIKKLEDLQGYTPELTSEQILGGTAPEDTDEGKLEGEDLQVRAKELDIQGRTTMTADELRKAVAKAEKG